MFLIMASTLKVVERHARERTLRLNGDSLTLLFIRRVLIVVLTKVSLASLVLALVLLLTAILTFALARILPAAVKDGTLAVLVVRQVQKAGQSGAFVATNLSAPQLFASCTKDALKLDVKLRKDTQRDNVTRFVGVDAKNIKSLIVQTLKELRIHTANIDVSINDNELLSRILEIITSESIQNLGSLVNVLIRLNSKISISSVSVRAA
jgi:hypothetical protein